MDGDFSMKKITFWSSLLATFRMNMAYLLRQTPRHKDIVENYPDTISGRAPTDMYHNFKGYLRNDLKKCTGCSDCVPVCPVKALEFHAEPRLTGGVKVQDFRIDLGKCFNCGVCVEACPEGSLFFSKDFELVSKRAEDLVMVLYGSEDKSDPEISKIRAYEVRR